MDVELILKVCGVATVITFVSSLLSKAGKDEQSNMVSLLGIVLVLVILAEKIGVLINTLKEVFGL
jgi:stage III sporulation protein AC